jgi:hypothetical protein
MRGGSRLCFVLLSDRPAHSSRAKEDNVDVLRVWAKDPFGAELAQVTATDGTLSASGVAIGTHPTPYRLDYQLTTMDAYVTARLVVRAQGDAWRRGLDLQRAGSGAWSCTTQAEGNLDLPAPGGELDAVRGALDCDLGLSPTTNSMPVLRHRLHEGGGPIDLLMAWVSVPDLAVYPSRQRYAFVRRGSRARIVGFQSLDSPFEAEIGFDDDGVVLDYPGIARQVA